MKDRRQVDVAANGPEQSFVKVLLAGASLTTAVTAGRSLHLLEFLLQLFDPVTSQHSRRLIFLLVRTLRG